MTFASSKQRSLRSRQLCLVPAKHDTEEATSRTITDVNGWALSMVSDLAGVTEIDDILGVSRQRAAQLTGTPGFPVPNAELASGRIWRSQDVRLWSDAARRGGPAPAASFSLVLGAVRCVKVTAGLRCAPCPRSPIGALDVSGWSEIEFPTKLSASDSVSCAERARVKGKQWSGAVIGG
jgi:hypothetical protein